jgi:MFS family permease
MEATKLNAAEKIVILMSAISVTMLFSALSPALPQIQDIYAQTPNGPMLVKMLIGIIGGSMVVGCPAGGWLAKRFSHRKILTVSLAAYGVAGAAGLVLTDIHVLLGSRLVVGFAGAVSTTVALLSITELLEGDRRNAWIGLYVAAAMVANVLLLPIAGYLARTSWHLPFAMYLIYVPVALLCFFVRDVRTKAVASTESQNTSVSLTHLPLLVMAFVTGLLQFIPAIYIPFELREVGLHDPVQMSMGLTGATIISSTLCSLYGRTRRILDIRQSMTIALLIFAAGNFALAYATTVTGAFTGLFIFGVGMSWILPNLYALLGQLPELERPAVLGFAKGIMYVSTMVGVMMFEPVYRGYGTSGVFVGLAVCALAMLAYVFYDRARFGAPAQKQTVPAE